MIELQYFAEDHKTTKLFALMEMKAETATILNTAATFLI
jgi:hypothetical protein